MPERNCERSVREAAEIMPQPRPKPALPPDGNNLGLIKRRSSCEVLPSASALRSSCSRASDAPEGLARPAADLFVDSGDNDETFHSAGGAFAVLRLTRLGRGQ